MVPALKCSEQVPHWNAGISMLETMLGLVSGLFPLLNCQRFNYSSIRLKYKGKALRETARSYLMQNNKIFLMLLARGTELLFLCARWWTEGGQVRGEKIHDTPSIRLHHQGGHVHVWGSEMDASRSISSNVTQKDLLRRAENNVFLSSAR